MQKQTFGIYYTVYNPFHPQPLGNWFELIEKKLNKARKQFKCLEPFAGANNIVEMLSGNLSPEQWECYDIHPNNRDNTSGILVYKRNTLKRFPKGFDIVITNPPYLAKNRAKREGLEYPREAEKYVDLYLYALDVMLANVDFVAAIIPDSFLMRLNTYKKHIYAVDRLTKQLFEDTDEPVCVVYFVKDYDHDFEIYSDGIFITTYEELKSKEIIPSKTFEWVFNDPEGEIGLKAIDNTKTATIEFCKGEEMADRKISYSSRSYTRISGKLTSTEIDAVITEANRILNTYRKETHDIFLTAFKGLREDGKYRRRLSFTTARAILDKALSCVRKVGEC